MKNSLRDLLVGCELKDGWTIDAQRCPRVGSTGACHSAGFIAKHPVGNTYAFCSRTAIDLLPSAWDSHLVFIGEEDGEFATG